MRLLFLSLLCLLMPAVASAAEGRDWASVRSWALQLEGIDPAAVAASPFDLVVLDYSRDGTHAGRFTSEEVAAMKVKPDGSRRRVVAWLPVGHAARHRFYWHAEVEQAPWLGPAVPDWDGLYRVRYWDPEWHGVMYGSADAWVDQAVAAGFDGVAVDPGDAAAYFEEQGWSTAHSDLVELVRALAAHARQAGGADFGVFMQNADDFANDPLVLRTVTGIVQQGTWFDVSGPTSPENTEGLTSLGRVARLAGALVLALDFTVDPEQVKKAHACARDMTFLEYAAPAALDRLLVLPGIQP